MCNNCIATICPNITIAQCTFVFWVSKQNGCSVYYRKEVPVARCNTTLYYSGNTHHKFDILT